MSRDDPQNVPFLYWNQMTSEDKEEYVKLRKKFHDFQRTPSKDRRVISFQHELELILSFVECRPANREIRSICCGAAFGGCYVCVNTRQLKNFMGRCKSSINGSFHQLGYIGLKAKTKAKQCLSNILSTLVNDQNLFRQWTVRCTGNEAMSCFVSSFPVSLLPPIQAEDLNDGPIQNSESSAAPLTASSMPINIPPSVTPEPTPVYQHSTRTVQFGFSNESYSQEMNMDPYSYVNQMSDPRDSILPVTELMDPIWNNPLMDVSLSNKVLTRSQSGSFSQNHTQFMGDFSLF